MTPTDYLPEELNTKYFDFKPRDYSDKKFCDDLLHEIKVSHDKCEYYKEHLCKKFKFRIPEELSFDELETIPFLPTTTYKKMANRTLQLLKASLDDIAIFSCSSSTTGDPSIVPRTIEDYNTIQLKFLQNFLDGRI